MLTYYAITKFLLKAPSSIWGKIGESSQDYFHKKLLQNLLITQPWPNKTLLKDYNSTFSTNSSIPSLNKKLDNKNNLVSFQNLSCKNNLHKIQTNISMKIIVNLIICRNHRFFNFQNIIIRFLY